MASLSPQTSTLITTAMWSGLLLGLQSEDGDSVSLRTRGGDGSSISQLAAASIAAISAGFTGGDDPEEAGCARRVFFLRYSSKQNEDGDNGSQHAV